MAEFDARDVLGLTGNARQDARLTKKMLVAQHEKNPADARLINRLVASGRVVGVLRPETIAVPAATGPERPAMVIPVFDIALAASPPSDLNRLVELLHRSSAQPMVVFLRPPDAGPLLSLALTHVNTTDPDRASSVIEHALLVPVLGIAPGALRVDRLARTDLAALYRDLVRTAAADGRPASAALTAESALVTRRQLVDLEAELSASVRAATREKNMQRRIDLNARGRGLRAEIERVSASLYSANTPDQEAAQ